MGFLITFKCGDTYRVNQFFYEDNANTISCQVYMLGSLQFGFEMLHELTGFQVLDLNF